MLKVGDEVDVKLLEIDPKTGKMRLSMRALTDKPEGYVEPERRPRPERGPRRDGDSRAPRRDGDRPVRREGAERGPKRTFKKEHRDASSEANLEEGKNEIF